MNQPGRYAELLRLHRVLKKLIPSRLREARFGLRRVGPVRFVRYRRLQRVERRKPPPRAGQPFDIGGGVIILHASTVRSVLSHWVEYGHGIQELRAFKSLAPGHRLLLDIGAAEGIYAAAFCSLTGQRAWAFEPSPEMFGRLEHLRQLNPNLNIAATNIALGASAGERTVRQYADGQFSGVGAAPEDVDIMALTTLDAFVEDHGLAPDMVKLDVEGMELDVLRGGERTFREAVRTIVLEAHYELLGRLGQSMADLQAVLEDYGFRFEALDGACIDDLASYAQAHPELLPGYTVIVCRKNHG